jgi:ABC-type Fe3+-hydroxamate transport system substrate-binding protein
MQTRPFIDQLHFEVRIPFPAQRIVSLVPSQTELLFDLGLDNRVVGITKFCIHPSHWPNHKTIVGGTKNFDTGLIDSLKPDLIIGNKEENHEDGIRELKKRYPVWMSDIYTREDALAMIQSIGEITNTSNRAMEIIDAINVSFKELRKSSQNKKVLYLIWRKPWMAAGGNTFISSMIEAAGLRNVFDNRFRYPELTPEEIRNLNPDIVFLSTEPFPFRQKHIAELGELLPHAIVLLVDGEMFSWYGSRMRLAPDYFNSIRIE